jgi:beta-phosphoglucomutase
VIVESNAIKDQAFHTLYLRYGESAADCAQQMNMQNPGASRFEKFAMIHKTILERVITPAESRDLGQRFSALCFDAVCTCPMVPGAEEFLTTYGKRVTLALASATPEDELVAIIKKRGLARYFKHACGKPRSKVESLSHILSCEGLNPTEAVFVGDQSSDREAAQEAGIAFVRRVESDVSKTANEGSIINIMELAKLLAL